MNKLLTSFAACCLALFCARAAEYTWKGDADDDWEDATKWADGEKPDWTSGEIVIVGSGRTFKVTDDTVAKVAALTCLYPQNYTASIVFDISTNATIGCALTYPASLGASQQGTCRKTGAGTLFLNARGVYAKNDWWYDYAIDFDVSDGAVAFPQDLTTSPSIYCGAVDLSGTGTFWMPLTSATKGLSFKTRGVRGTGGTFALAPKPTNAGSHYLRFEAAWWKPAHVFAGKLTGPISFNVDIDWTLTGTESDTSGYIQIPGGVTCAASYLGQHGAASSVGTGFIWIKTGCFKYIGIGETTTRTVEIREPSTGTFAKFPYSEAVVDAGPNGGVTFNTDWVWSSIAHFRPLVLAGSNTAVAVHNGNLSYAAGYGPYIVKRGPGTWRLDGTRTNTGVHDVEDGTLQFTSIAETGVSSALGTSDFLFEKYFANSTTFAGTRIPHAFILGGAEGTTGTMEYVGTADATAKTRLFALRSSGRILNGGTGALTLGAVTTLGAGAKTLTLGGDNAGENSLLAVSNATDDATVTLAKEGTNGWTVTGSSVCAGTLEAKGGSLTIRGTRDYRWYRWTIKENFYTSVTKYGRDIGATVKEDRTPRLLELALYDADGVRQNLGLTNSAWLADASALPKGAAMTPRTYTEGLSIAPLFDGNTTTGSALQQVAGREDNPDRAKSSTWITVVMHLDDSANPIASYDFMNTFGTNDVANMRYSCDPAIGMMEGSADGKTWYVLTDELAEYSMSPIGGSWSSDGTTTGADRSKTYALSAAHEPTHEVLTGLTGLAVAGGATVRIDGSERPTVSTLAVDRLSSVCTVDGFTFAATGTLDVRTSERTSAGTLPVTFANCTGVENIASWSVSVNGVLRPGRKVKFEDGVLRVCAAGAVILIR